MKTYVFFLFIFIEFLSVFVDARQAPSFASLESSINGKIGDFKNNCSGKLNSFDSSVNGKLDAWNSNYKQAQQNFQNSINSKCDNLSSSISNKLASLQSSMDSKFDSAGFSKFKNDSNDAFKNLASEIGQAKNNFKSALQSDLGAGYSDISSDFDTLNSGLQTESSDISNDFETGGELAEAVDEAEDAYQAANSPVDTSASRGWTKGSDGWYRMTLGAGTWTLRTSGSIGGWCFFANAGGNDPANGRSNGGPGTSFTTSSGGVIQADHESTNPKYHQNMYFVSGDASQPDPGGSGFNDADGDGVSDSDEVAAGTNPNDSNSVPAVEKEPETKSGVDGAKTGISAFDEIIAKLSPDFSAFSGAGSEDFSMTIPVNLGLYQANWELGNFDSLLGGKITWIRIAIRNFIIAILTFLFLRNLINVFREW